MKNGQTTIEFIIIVSLSLLIVAIAVYSVYYFISKTSASITTSDITILDFNTLSYTQNSTTDDCGVGFSFNSGSQISNMPIKLQIFTPQNKLYLISITNTTYSSYYYENSEGTYFYNYTPINTPINATVCKLFTMTINNNTGTIDGVISFNNGKELLYKLSPAVSTTIP